MAREVHVIREKVSFINLVGRIAGRSNNTLTILELADTKRIHVGMFLRTGVRHDQLRAGALEVVATNEENSTVTVADATAVTGLCADDQLYWIAERP